MMFRSDNRLISSKNEEEIAPKGKDFIQEKMQHIKEEFETFDQLESKYSDSPQLEEGDEKSASLFVKDQFQVIYTTLP
ncbi:hypothetical protein C0J52_14581 [Blattella germanica]|nr:hypothetical protein C0J52_14581 [Blattella germanica]